MSTKAASISRLEKELSEARARIFSLERDTRTMEVERDNIMDIITEVLRGMRPGHAEYVQREAAAYYARATGKPWDEAIRPVR